MTRQQKWISENRERRNLNARNSYQMHRLKALARNTVNHALRIGTLKRLPCEVCGNPKSHGHHEDYSKQLEVKWLCVKHHQEIHAKPKKVKVGRNSKNQHSFKGGKDNPSFGRRWIMVNGKRQYKQGV